MLSEYGLINRQSHHHRNSLIVERAFLKVMVVAFIINLITSYLVTLGVTSIETIIKDLMKILL